MCAWQLSAGVLQDDPGAGIRQGVNRTGGRIYTFMHTWDLARATGQDERLDTQTGADLLAEMVSIQRPADRTRPLPGPGTPPEGSPPGRRGPAAFHHGAA